MLTNNPASTGWETHFSDPDAPLRVPFSLPDAKKIAVDLYRSAILYARFSWLAVTVLLMRRPILTEKLARRGQHVTREYSVDVFETLRVADAMGRTAPTISANMSIEELAEAIARPDPALGRRQAYVLVDEENRLAGIATRGDVLRAFTSPENRHKSVREFAERDVVVTYPDETLHTAVSKILQHDIRRLVVVERAQPRRVVGYLGRGDILRAQRRRHEEEQARERGPLLALRPKATTPPLSH